MHLANRREVDGPGQGWGAGTDKDLVLPPTGSFIFSITRSFGVRNSHSFCCTTLQIQGKPLDISSVIHPGRVTLQFVQLADLSNYVFLLLVSEPEGAVPASLRKVGGSGGGGTAAESKSKVDEYLSLLEFPSASS